MFKENQIVKFKTPHCKKEQWGVFNTNKVLLTKTINTSVPFDEIRSKYPNHLKHLEFLSDSNLYSLYQPNYFVDIAYVNEELYTWIIGGRDERGFKQKDYDKFYIHINDLSAVDLSKYPSKEYLKMIPTRYLRDSLKEFYSGNMSIQEYIQTKIELSKRENLPNKREAKKLRREKVLSRNPRQKNAR